jgi:alkane 1-monooxygenase
MSAVLSGIRTRPALRHAWWLSLVVPALAFIAYGLVRATGLTAFFWLGPVFVYGLVPLLDGLVGSDARNPSGAATQDSEGDDGTPRATLYRVILAASLPLQLGGTVFGAWLAVRGGLDTVSLVGWLLTVGIVNAAGINAGHEWGHGRGRGSGWMAKLALAPSAYGHFFVEHNRGHHVRVATPEDPASARFGESYWRFLPRTLVGSLRSAWALEQQRLAARGLGVWHWRNDNLQAWTLTLLLFGGLTLWLGIAVLPFLLLQALYAACLLEAVNYLEHYGLARQRNHDGRYERCTPQHSWNSDRIVSNLLLYQLQRHSDHHANPRRPYQTLRHFDDSPQLPAGYGALIPLVYLPPLWFRLMNPRVLAHYGGDATRVSRAPS